MKIIMLTSALAVTVFIYSCSTSNAVKGGVIGGVGGVIGDQFAA